MAFNRSADGSQLPDPTKFPQGFKAVADAIHGMGMKSGLYTAKGPHTCQKRAASCLHEAQDAKQWASWGVDYVRSPFPERNACVFLSMSLSLPRPLSPSLSLSLIAVASERCGLLKMMLIRRKQVKDDSCSTCMAPNGSAYSDMADYHRMWQGIQASGRPMILTVEGSPPADIITHGGYGNAKRVGHDISPSWGSMISLVDIGSGLWP